MSFFLYYFIAVMTLTLPILFFGFPGKDYLHPLGKCFVGMALFAIMPIFISRVTGWNDPSGMMMLAALFCGVRGTELISEGLE